MSLKVLVFIEQREGKIKSTSREALATAGELTGKNTADIAAVIIGQSSQSLASQVKGWGADVIYTVEGAQYEHYNVQHYAAALTAAIKTFQPQVILGVASSTGRDLFPRVAARVDAGLITDITAVSVENGQFVGGTKPLYAGKVLADVRFEGNGLRMATIRPNVFAVSDFGGKAESTPLVVPESPVTLKATAVRKGANDKVDLTEASRIISGGRPVGSQENFKIINDCADVIRASVGASRAAVDAGFATHDMQVGQTGKTVNPSLYIACAISGSIQHMAGMRSSKVIVAINTDPDAPIFAVADYGIVADIFEAVPLLTKKFKELLG